MTKPVNDLDWMKVGGLNPLFGWGIAGQNCDGCGTTIGHAMVGACAVGKEGDQTVMLCGGCLYKRGISQMFQLREDIVDLIRKQVPGGRLSELYEYAQKLIAEGQSDE